MKMKFMVLRFCCLRCGIWEREESRMTPIFLLEKLDRQLFHTEKMRRFRLKEVDMRNNVFSFINSKYEALMRCLVVPQVRIQRAQGTFWHEMHVGKPHAYRCEVNVRPKGH